ncbi:uncharacterized protein RMCC_0581 [Mycolicibacterium canariasense]|uniref:ANTAR domain-containing protein n=1 Tax=Mycolicibacterium canariasense TaxID=228230 RepID=A0A117I8R3_MYCCR|nr:ANTAR domain-containing protein [Mycolicibacterium canariasense]MCV7213344.1 ANTAR domain-containing protein [Mycolicibacterium canariasense]ORV10591.1 hypothetical protein AWB94_06700 [Mycolicibacterium canariasense]GAS93615.1 uncharacterized protein RMCC_0581 [Mycolicibacterium canariasense]
MRDPRRSLGAAEGVLVALGQCHRDDAFAELVDAAKRHNVSVIELAEALMAMVDDTITPGIRGAVLAAAEQSWGTLLARRYAGNGTKNPTALPTSQPGHHPQPRPNLMEAIPRADEADLAEQSDGMVAPTLFADEPIGSIEADPADVLEQRTTVDDDDERLWAADPEEGGGYT